MATLHGRYFVEKTGDRGDAAVPDHRKIGAFDGRVDEIARPQSPGEPHVVAMAVGLTDQAEAEIGEALLYAADQAVEMPR
jgi:hypothetical protein